MPIEITVEQLDWVANELCTKEYPEATSDPDELLERLENTLSVDFEGLELLLVRMVEMGWLRIPHIEPVEGNVGRVIQQLATNMIEDALNDAQDLQNDDIRPICCPN